MRDSFSGGGALLVLTFFLITPIALVTSVYALVSFGGATEGEVKAYEAENLIAAPQAGVQVYASLPNQSPSVWANARVEDARAEIVRQYLKRYNSPLVSHAEVIVEMADKYDLDFRLTTAIAQQESNLCKRFPVWTFNCWGYGIHSAGTLGFDSFDHGIETVSRGLRVNYHDLGLVTPEEVMSKWVPHSPEGAWAKGVSAFMEDME